MNLNSEDFEALTRIADAAHENALAHGFYDDIVKLMMVAPNEKYELIAYRDFVLSQIAKIGGECGECVDAIQHGALTESDKCDHLCEELADIIIRTFDLCGYLNVDIGEAVKAKMLKNEGRPYKHGKEC